VVVHILVLQEEVELQVKEIMVVTQVMRLAAAEVAQVLLEEMQQMVLVVLVVLEELVLRVVLQAHQHTMRVAAAVAVKVLLA
jgi:hypothetical protein